MKWKTCLNCKVPAAGCLCKDCLRAGLVPLLLAAAIKSILEMVGC